MGQRSAPADHPPARRLRTVVAGTGLLAGVTAGLTGALGLTLARQGRTATRVIEAAALEAARRDGTLTPSVSGAVGGPAQRAGDTAAQVRLPRGDGVYRPDGTGPYRSTGGGPGARRTVTVAMVGDSTAVGYGCRTAAELPGVVLAVGLAARTDRPVRLVTRGVVGAGAADLARQLAAALPAAPDVVVIVVGANDIRDKVPPHRSAHRLGEAVATLRGQGIPVVVGTCPDFGVIAPIPQPLRTVLHQWSRRLAELQERAVTAAGGRAVAIGRLVSPEFAGRPDLFAADGFHPSGPGYARAVAALLPEVVAGLAERTPVSGG
ncbi:SGNH/GDSL hydrolase family protein [Nakamurella leprariae]|uniref:SGNH/GDSL hydrolase family protein n=1 Tax=Nakamurella leprariae TaxID=2803911 RepID=A0A938YDC7_9ACTN|nr:SGNH/GDSL hydrolase family protein [Nakamurella leprariae]MBM9468602.1 SGNH/GDSL hydrolase family protein [Nakamurella leprariae]